MTATLVAALLVLLLFAVLLRGWPEEMPRSALPLVLPALALLAAHALSLAHPGMHAREAAGLAAGRAEPFLLMAPEDPPRVTGAPAPEGARVPLPHSPAARLLAWPMAGFVGDGVAVRALALFAVGATILLGFPLARDLGFGSSAALGLQLVLLALPGWALAYTGGEYPALLGLFASTLLTAHVVRRLSHLEGARDSAAATFFFAWALAAAGGFLLAVSAFALVLAAWERAKGDGRRSLRILGSWAVALLVVAITVYAPFLGALCPEIFSTLQITRPSARMGAAVLLATGGPWVVLAVAGLAVPDPARARAWRPVAAAFVAAVLVLAMRAIVHGPGLAAPGPTTGEMLLAVAPMAALALLFLRRTWERGGPWRLVAAASALASSSWSALAWSSALR